jgi:hypothetical protein
MHGRSVTTGTSGHAYGCTCDCCSGSSRPPKFPLSVMHPATAGLVLRASTGAELPHVFSRLEHRDGRNIP